MRKTIALTGCHGFIGKHLAQHLESCDHYVMPYRTDAMTAADLDKSPEVLIHCARHHKNITGALDHKKWLDEYMTDVVLPYETSLDFVKVHGTSNIIFISSVYGVEPPKVRYIPPNYVCSKAAEIHAAQNLAVQLAPKTRVNTIILGGVRSSRPEADQTKDFLKKYRARTLLDKMVSIKEIYGVLDLLISDASKGMTGAKITVDGGYLV